MNAFLVNKILGAVLATCLLLQVVHIAAGALFSQPTVAKPGYQVAMKEEQPAQAKTGGAPAASGQPIAALLPTASPTHGAQIAKQCELCHNLQKGQGAKIGPDLYGVVDRSVASVAGFHYSAALKAKGGKWTFDALNVWLTNPRADVPGTLMTFAGLPSEKQRADVISFLDTLSDHPVPLPHATASAAPPSATTATNGTAPAQPPAAPKKAAAEPAKPAAAAPNKAPAAPAKIAAEKPAAKPAAATPEKAASAPPATPAAPAKPEVVAANAPAAAAADASSGNAEFDKLLAAASVKRGAAIAKQCQLCHNVGKGQGKKVGPDLYDVVGRKVASMPGFNYSAALKAKGGTWTFAALDKWLTDPRKDVPGTLMTFAGLSRAKQRADVIAYLDSLSDHPKPLPKP